MVLVPDFIPTFMTEPGRQPYSAFGFCRVLNSWMASIGTMDCESPTRYWAPSVKSTGGVGEGREGLPP